MDAASGTTIYVNPATVRFVLPAGHKSILVFSETHTITVTGDLQAVMQSGLFELSDL
ncbi:hypothetical protein [Bradyrhizobium sp. SUTN9-2]|uniref:hypothetical protein n=1 Tax=Bradyrhizobium TaxID=374 RepID=UPI001304F65B|nr:hypothetical protein [Bradyrhizobium sp. SUTN9-2]